MKLALKIFFNKYWRFFFGLYALIYLPCFFAIEKKITIDYPGIHIINGAIDDMIPFLEIFIIPYLLWFVYVVAACIFMVFKADDKEFLRFALSLVIGMTLFLVISVIYPNALTLRPDQIPDNIFGRLVMGLYGTDTSTNVFPSIHVFNSLAVDIALHKCNALRNNKPVKAASRILCILIILSTMFLKQHSVYDVLGGFVMMIVLYILLYVVDYSKLFNREEKEEQTVDVN